MNITSTRRYETALSASPSPLPRRRVPPFLPRYERINRRIGRRRGRVPQSPIGGQLLTLLIHHRRTGYRARTSLLGGN